MTYGGLFLLAAAMLTAFTYLLVVRGPQPVGRVGEHQQPLTEAFKSLYAGTASGDDPTLVDKCRPPHTRRA